MPKGEYGFKKSNYRVDFTGRTETVEDVFGPEDLSPAQMTKALWAFVKANGLERRG